MKNFVCIFALIVVSLFATVSVKAIAGCGGNYYIVSDTYNIGGTVYGYSATELDYCAGLYNDPVVSGIFLENSSLLGQGYSEGYANQDPAIVSFGYSSPVAGQTYTNFGDHYIIAYYQVYVPYWNDWFWYDPWQIGFMEIGGGFEGPGYYGFGYAYYWTSQYIYVGSTSDSIIYCGQTQCGVGQQFSPTGVSCSFVPTSGGLCSEQTNLTIHIKDRNGNNIDGTTQNAMVGAPTYLTAESNDPNATLTWSFGNNSESEIGTSQINARVSWLEETNYNVSVTASKSGSIPKTAQVTVSVKAPTLEEIKANQKTPRVSDGVCQNTTDPLLILGCGNTINDVGIEIIASAKSPLGDISEKNNGAIQFVQLATIFRSRIDSTDGKQYCITKRSTPMNLSDGWGLDGEYPYGGTEPQPTLFGYKTIGNFDSLLGEAKASINDSPHSGLNLSSEKFVDDVFETYVVYTVKTIKGTLVERVIGKLPWSWQAKAVKNSNDKHTIEPLFSKPSNEVSITGIKITEISEMRKSVFQHRNYNGIVNNIPETYCGSELQPLDSAFVPPQIVPDSVETGQEFEVSITMRNTGTQTWTSVDFQLVSVAGNWSPQSVTLFNDALPGQTKTFTFTVTAPSTPGTYSFSWSMADRRSGTQQRFGAVSQSKEIEVTSPVIFCDSGGIEARSCYFGGGFFDSSTCSCQGGYWY